VNVQRKGLLEKGMFMEKILEVAHPLITSYPTIANRFTILSTDVINAKKYLSNNFINLIAINLNKTSGHYISSFIDVHLKSYHDNCPFLEYSGIIRHLAVRESENLTDFIELMIDKKYYLHLVLNNYFLSCSEFYNKKHFMHVTLVYGYDRENQTVMIADFYSHGKYTYSSVSYQEINDSYKYYFSDAIKHQPEIAQLGDIITKINIVEDNIDYEINIDQIKKQVEHYINSSNSYEFLLDDTNHDHIKKIYGLSYYDVLKIFSEEGRRNFGRRWAYTLLDHKSAWLIRLKSLYTERFIDAQTYSKLDSDFQELHNSTNILLNSILKYNYTFDDELLRRVIKRCSELKDKDESIMQNLLNVL